MMVEEKEICEFKKRIEWERSRGKSSENDKAVDSFFWGTRQDQ
jgi:hypothetical protein